MDAIILILLLIVYKAINPDTKEGCLERAEKAGEGKL